MRFIEFLHTNDKILADLVYIANTWEKSLKHSTTFNHDKSIGDIQPGNDISLDTNYLSEEEIDSLYKGFATAGVKERAIEFIKGFIQGIVFIT